MKKYSELKLLSADELQVELLTLRKKQFSLRVQKTTETLHGTHIVKQLRRSIARIKTIMTVIAGEANGK